MQRTLRYDDTGVYPPLRLGATALEDEVADQGDGEVGSPPPPPSDSNE